MREQVGCGKNFGSLYPVDVFYICMHILNWFGYDFSKAAIHIRVYVTLRLVILQNYIVHGYSACSGLSVCNNLCLHNLRFIVNVLFTVGTVDEAAGINRVYEK